MKNEIGKRYTSDLDTIVTIVCYGKAERMTKRQAEDLYKRAFNGSDGHEKQRYANILADLYYGANYGFLIWGKSICWDGEEDEIPNGYHVCQYCGSLAKGNDKDRLCDECAETFGHSTIDEL